VPLPTGSDHYRPPLTPPEPPDHATERALIERARQGDREAFAALVRTHIEHAMRLALRVLRDTEDAEDAVQDAFLLALRGIERFDASRPFGPWMSRIVVNRAIDIAKARRIRNAEPMSDVIADSSMTAPAMVEGQELEARVRAIAQTMAPRQRLIVELHDLDGHTIPEIAEITGSAAPTVRWHLHMGRRALRAALAPLYQTGK
jgi:RNA polymerase sigma-70 factor (ECF subfamily)